MMKKFNLLLMTLGVLLCWEQSVQAQCINTTAFLTNPAPAPTTTSQLTTCLYSVEYTELTAVAAATDYSTEAFFNTGTVQGYITITETTSSGTVVAHGPSPLAWTSNSAGTYYIHVTEDAGCTGGNNCHTVSVTNLSGCSAPTTLAVSNITATTADVTWVSTNTPLNTEVAIIPAGSGPPTTGASSGGSPFNATGLTVATAYDVYIREICSAAAGDTSVWIGPETFATSCIVFTAPYLEEFSVASLPACWSESGDNAWEYGSVVGGTVPVGFADYGAASTPDHSAGGGGTFIGMDGSDNGNGEVSILESPDVDISGLVNPEVSYWVFSNNVDDTALNKLTVDFYDGATWHQIDSIQENLGPVWIEFKEDLSTYTITGPVKLRFTVTGDGSGGNTYFNDIVIDDVHFRNLVCSGDTATTAIPLAGLNVSLTDSTSNNCFTNTSDGPGFPHAGADVWYSYLLDPCADSLIVSLCGSSFDTYLRIYAADGTTIIADNDDNGAVCGPGNNSHIELGVASTAGLNPGDQIYIVVDGYGANSGVFNLNITQTTASAGDDLANAIPASGNFSTAGSTTCNTDQYGGVAGTNTAPDVWYQYVVGDCADSLIVSMCGSSFDTRLYILNSDGTTELFYDDDGCPGTTRSLLELDVDGTTLSQGDTVYIIVDGYLSNAGAYTLDITETTIALPGDNASTAIVLNGPNVNVTGTTDSCYTDQSSGPGFPHAAEDVWYQYILGACADSLTVSLCGSSFDTYLKVYASDATTTIVDNDDNGAVCGPGNNSHIELAVASTAGLNPGDTVYIVVDGYGANKGVYNLNVTETATTVNADITYATTSICIDSMAYTPTINGTTGGTFMSPTLTVDTATGEFFANTVGVHQIYYTVGSTPTCSDVDTATITITSLVTASINIDANASCNGTMDGGLTASGMGGTGTYTYTWSNAATTASIIGVGAGSYMVTVSDTNGCMDTTSAMITEPTAIVATVVVDSNASCNGAMDGGLTASAMGGTGAYTYTWSNAATTAGITGVGAGSYVVIVSDANGCMDTASVMITEPTAIVATVVVDANASCNGTMDGGLTASAMGGTGAYTYAWSNTATTSGITGVGAGSYTVIVSDANGCMDTASATVTEPTAIVATVMDDGTGNSATAMGTGGTAGYSFIWDAAAGNQVTATATGLTAGTTYCVTVSDVNGCSDTACVNIIVTTIEDIANATEFKVYPNPTTGKVFVELDFEHSNTVQLDVYNTVGAQVLSKQLVGQNDRIELDMENLPTGVYMMRFAIDQEIKVHQLVIQRH